MEAGRVVPDDDTRPDAKGLRNPFRNGGRRMEQDTPDSIPAEGSPRAAARAVASNRDAENYHMAHPRRGVALLLNHERVSSMDVRRGTDKDCTDLSLALYDLGFEVDVRKDLTYLQIKDCLREVAAMDHSDADCLLVAVMTHGDPDILFAKDKSYQVKELWEPFTPDKCVTLTGKPKLFFIQACRGSKVDDGVLVTDSLSQDFPDGSVIGYTIPLQADILVAYATVEGYYSWRNPKNGSWFIQSLCKELRLNGTSRDLLTLLTFVCRRVAIDYESVVPVVYEMDRKKQVPTITSTLTRLVFFPSKKGNSTRTSPSDTSPKPEPRHHRFL